MKELTVKKVDWQTENLPEILRLYRAAFPQIERVDFDTYLDDPVGNLDILSFWDGSLFCGFAAFMTYDDLTQILYFAIEEDLRGQGYGSAALAAMRAYYGGRIMADLEDPFCAPNDETRVERYRRVGFYERAGYRLTDVRFEWEGENYVMMISGGEQSTPSLTMEEYESFWRRAEQDRGNHPEKMDKE
ncbi:MAG: GNAT family N-acetyltransferase [Firmicutes bacterium]|nr:GNAT family N-acetyltransferase [Bacillota bacterium]